MPLPKQIPNIYIPAGNPKHKVKLMGCSAGLRHNRAVILDTESFIRLRREYNPQDTNEPWIEAELGLTLHARFYAPIDNLTPNLSGLRRKVRRETIEEAVQDSPFREEIDVLSAICRGSFDYGNCEPRCPYYKER